MGLMLAGQESSLCRNIQTVSGAYTHSYPVGIKVLTLEVKCPGQEANHSSETSAEVKNAWSYISIPPYVCMAWYLIFILQLSSSKIIYDNLCLENCVSIHSLITT